MDQIGPPGDAGGLVFPDDNQALTYDLDGNVTFDGTWSYEWDVENRLRLEFTYDFQGRRIQKIVSTDSTGSSFVPQCTNRFVYDGWNLLGVLDSGNSILVSFTWGQNLSGTMDDAGGIGGLLLMQTH